MRRISSLDKIENSGQVMLDACPENKKDLIENYFNNISGIFIIV